MNGGGPCGRFGIILRMCLAGDGAQLFRAAQDGTWSSPLCSWMLHVRSAAKSRGAVPAVWRLLRAGSWVLWQCCWWSPCRC